MVNPNINQFAQTPVDGELDMSFVGPIVSARTSNAQVTALVAGQAVAGDTTTPGTSQDGVPPVISLASNSVAAIGFVARNIKDQTFPANARLELALDGACMYKTANAAITRFSPVEYDTATNTVIAWAGVNPICGYAYDAAIAQGDLIRIIISSPQMSASNTSATMKTANITATLAQINAGLVLIPGATGKRINVVDYTARVNGSSFAGGTNVILESNNVSPVVVSTIAEAGLASGAILKPTSANTTLGAGFSVPLGSGDGLQIVSTGTQTTATGITFTIVYTQS